MSKSPMNDVAPEDEVASPAGWVGQFHLALSFLTRLPVPDPGFVAGGLAPAMRFFPLVGGLLGLAAGGVSAMAGWILLPPLPAAFLAILSMVLLTGALHEDGLADLADGLGARGDVAKRLEVMRDSRIGAYGVLGLLFSVGLRVSGLAVMPGGWRMVAALATAAALSRALIPCAMQVMAPARSDGLGAAAGLPDASVAAAALGLALALALATVGPQAALAALVGALLPALAVVFVARRMLGGFTGDVLGAVQQAAEAGALLALAATLS